MLSQLILFQVEPYIPPHTLILCHNSPFNENLWLQSIVMTGKVGQKYLSRVNYQDLREKRLNAVIQERL